MKTKYKFIHFELAEVWHCLNNKNNGILGLVYFYNPWKQWCFFPWGNTVFNDTCLADIQHFIGQLKEDKT